MKELLSKCGFRCDLCPAYHENIQSNDDKVKLSDDWRRLFGFNLTPDEVECVGCHNEGKHADPGCPVRPCVMEKGIANCAYCNSFGCDSLKSRMDFLDNSLAAADKQISAEDYKRFLTAYEAKSRLLKLKEDLKTNKK
jgi:hypothetical protein